MVKENILWRLKLKQIWLRIICYLGMYSERFQKLDINWHQMTFIFNTLQSTRDGKSTEKLHLSERIENVSKSSSVEVSSQKWTQVKKSWYFKMF